MKHGRLIGSLTIAIIGVATVSVALSAASSGSAKSDAKAVRTSHAATAAVREARATTDGDNIQQGDQTSPDAGVAVSLVKARAATPADGDNVQQGDQTSPDAGPATSCESTGESCSMSESAPSDGPGGFADTSATADTQQQGEH